MFSSFDITSSNYDKNVRNIVSTQFKFKDCAEKQFQIFTISSIEIVLKNLYRTVIPKRNRYINSISDHSLFDFIEYINQCKRRSSTYKNFHYFIVQIIDF